MVAETPVGDVDDERLARYLRLALAMGTHMGLATGGMAAVVGPRRARVAAILAEVDPDGQCGHRPAEHAHPPGGERAAGDLDRLHARLDDVARAEVVDRQRGRRGGAPLRFGWQALPVDAPYHSPAWRRRPGPLHRLADIGGGVASRRPASTFGLPVISPVDGSDLRRCPPASADGGRRPQPVRRPRRLGRRHPGPGRRLDPRPRPRHRRRPPHGRERAGRRRPRSSPWPPPRVAGCWPPPAPRPRSPTSATPTSPPASSSCPTAAATSTTATPG